MKTPEFNLLEEAWIRVLKDDCSEELVSLPEAMIHAHEYRDLCGDTPEQDMAVLRLLLAVLHTIFSKMDEDGQDNVIDTPTQARKRWRALWEKGYFKEDVIRTYLENIMNASGCFMINILFGRYRKQLWEPSIRLQN